MLALDLWISRRKGDRLNEPGGGVGARDGGIPGHRDGAPSRRMGAQLQGASIPDALVPCHEKRLGEETCQQRFGNSVSRI
jgi:hypothetical protein